MSITFWRKKAQEDWEVKLEQYEEWRSKTYPMTIVREREWIRFFFIKTKIKNVSHVSLADVEKTCQYVEENYRTQFSRSQFLRSMSNFMAFFHARGTPCLSRKSFTKVIHRV